MELLLNGNTENFICLRYLIKSRTVMNRFFFCFNFFFFHTYAKSSELPSNIGTSASLELLTNFARGRDEGE